MFRISIDGRAIASGYADSREIVDSCNFKKPIPVILSARRDAVALPFLGRA